MRYVGCAARLSFNWFTFGVALLRRGHRRMRIICLVGVFRASIT